MNIFITYIFISLLFHSEKETMDLYEKIYSETHEKGKVKLIGQKKLTDQLAFYLVRADEVDLPDLEEISDKQMMIFSGDYDNFIEGSMTNKQFDRCRFEPNCTIILPKIKRISNRQLQSILKGRNGPNILMENLSIDSPEQIQLTRMYTNEETFVSLFFLSKRLNKSTIATLKDLKGFIQLNNIEIIEKKSIKTLLSIQRSINFSGLKNIDLETFQELCLFNGNIVLGGLKELTADHALAVKKSNAFITFMDVKKIDDNVFDIMKDCNNFFLPSLTELSINQSKYISGNEKLSSRYYRDNNFTSISDDLLSTFFKIGDGHYSSCFGGIKKISKNILGYLDKIKYSELFISFNSVKSISLEVARVLGSLSGTIHLNGIEEISEPVLEKLAEFSGDLYLNGIKKLTESQAKILGKHKGTLHLDGLLEIDEKGLENLSRHIGSISMARVRNINDVAFSEFIKNANIYTFQINNKRFISPLVLLRLKPNQMVAQFYSPFSWSFEKSNPFVNLSGVTELSNFQAKCLSSANVKINLSGVKTLNDTQWRQIIQYKFPLHFYSLSDLTFEQSKILSNRVGDLSLPLISPEPRCLKNLAKIKGDLNFPAIKKLNPESFHDLSHHQGNIELDGVFSAKISELETICRNNGIVFMLRLGQIDFEGRRNFKVPENLIINPALLCN